MDWGKNEENIANFMNFRTEGNVWMNIEQTEKYIYFYVTNKHFWLLLDIRHTHSERVEGIHSLTKLPHLNMFELNAHCIMSYLQKQREMCWRTVAKIAFLFETSFTSWLQAKKLKTKHFIISFWMQFTSTVRRHAYTVLGAINNIHISVL